MPEALEMWPDCLSTMGESVRRASRPCRWWRMSPAFFVEMAFWGRHSNKRRNYSVAKEKHCQLLNKESVSETYPIHHKKRESSSFPRPSSHWEDASVQESWGLRGRIHINTSLLTPDNFSSPKEIEERDFNKDSSTSMRAWPRDILYWQLLLGPFAPHSYY